MRQIAADDNSRRDRLTIPIPRTEPTNAREKEHYQNRLDDARSMWAFRLDEDTLDFVHCDLCLESLAVKDSQAIARNVGLKKGKPFIETMAGRGLTSAEDRTSLL